MIDQSTNKLYSLGIVKPLVGDKIHPRHMVFHPKGICKTLLATDVKDPPRVLICRKKTK